MMAPDEARELFSEAFDGELDAEREKAFQDALAADDALKAEYDDFVETLGLVSRFGEEEEPPDLLHGVQERLRKRSRGRYYRDRFSRRAGPGWIMPLLVSVGALLLLGVIWYAMHAVVLEAETQIPGSAETPSGELGR